MLVDAHLARAALPGAATASGGPELMACRCHELSLSNDQLLDSIGHLVERSSGLANFMSIRWESSPSAILVIATVADCSGRRYRSTPLLQLLEQHDQQAKPELLDWGPRSTRRTRPATTVLLSQAVLQWEFCDRERALIFAPLAQLSQRLGADGPGFSRVSFPLTLSASLKRGNGVWDFCCSQAP